jgi:hypothetical protein
MSYSIAKMIEFALSYLLSNDLMLKKTTMPDEARQNIIDYFNLRIQEIRNQHK